MSIEYDQDLLRFIQEHSLSMLMKHVPVSTRSSTVPLAMKTQAVSASGYRLRMLKKTPAANIIT
jgi:hypothetical protein